VVRVTGNFQSESPLHPKAFEVLHAAFENGWANPGKLSQSGSKANQVRNQALESIAAALKVPVDSIFAFPSMSLGFYLGIQGLGIQGLLKESLTLVHGATDRKDVFAIASRVPHQVLSSALDGKLVSPSQQSPNSVLALSVANAETGVIQECDDIIRSVNTDRIFLDATASGIRVQGTNNYSTAIFDSRSWYGPGEVGLLVVNNKSQWSNPLPHLNAAHPNFDASLPLLLASAVALENFSSEVEEANKRARNFNSQLRDSFAQIPDVDIAGLLDSSLAHLLSVSFMNCNGEELLRGIQDDGFSVDSGSACTADNLEPSHVLAAMGVLTHGNIRITIHPETTQAEIDSLISSVKKNVERLRS
jgi:cysteine desulfurase